MLLDSAQRCSLSLSPFPPPDMSGDTTPSLSEEHAYLSLIAAAIAKVTPGKTTDSRSRVEDVVKSTWSVVGLAIKYL